MLDPVSPDHFHPAFAGALEHLRHSGGLSGFTCLSNHVLIALDGTEYHRSAKVHCPQCSSRKRAHGGTEYVHSLLAATLVAPGTQRVLPLPPEFVAPQDGCNKQDCESRAARRWLAKHGADYAGLNPAWFKVRSHGEAGLVLPGRMMAPSCFQVRCEYGSRCWRRSRAARE